MNVPVGRVTPSLENLFAPFGSSGDQPEYEVVPASEVPPPYHGLLCHEHHMTVTVEAHHGDLVDVRILARQRQGDSYTRKIILALQKTGRIVQFGIVRIDLAACSPQVREEITAGQTPLGRILIQHDVLRRIEPTAYLRIQGGPAQMAWFNQEGTHTLYGRLAIIHCDGKPAVELLEIVAPE
jgi:chorismate-pyruvate lyase